MSYRDDMHAAAVASLTEALRQAGGYVATAATIAGVSRQHFYKLCKKHGITLERAKRYRTRGNESLQEISA